jgi:hypothetical protein
MDAFLWAAPAAVAAIAAIDVPAKLPTFKPRWWYSSQRLDARPVAWSLINRPEDWEWGRYPNGEDGRLIILHKPSVHEFWVGSGRGFYRLHSADCGCSSTRGRFQHFQQGLFHRAFTQWQDAHSNYDTAHFADHFVR